MITILFARERRRIQVEPGSTLLHAAGLAGVDVHRPQPGLDGNGDCAVELRQGMAGATPRTALENDLPPNLRLASEAKLYADTTVVTQGDVKFISDTAAPSWGVFTMKALHPGLRQ